MNSKKVRFWPSSNLGVQFYILRFCSFAVKSKTTSKLNSEAPPQKPLLPYFFWKNTATWFFIRKWHCSFAAILNQSIQFKNMAGIRIYWIALIFIGVGATAFAQHDNHSHPQKSTEQQEASAHAVDSHDALRPNEAPHEGCGHPIVEKVGEFNAGETAVHHIADANAIQVVGDIYIPLPCFLYAPGQGWTITTTSAFHPHHHGNGTLAKDAYVLVHGSIQRVQDPGFPKGEVSVSEPTHEERIVNGKKKDIYFVMAEGKCYELDKKTTFDGGLMGGGVTSFYDYSITRNVFTMLLTCLVLFFLFRKAANAATRTHGHAPKGLQNFIEPFYTFIRDDVARPSIGPKYEKYMPYLLSVFFFILGLNLIGQIPFFPGSANVTGNISVTIVLALLTFVLMLASTKRYFWEHTLWMPGVPAALKILILTPVEILGLFLKPFTLILRLFANITAGHIVIMCFVGLIFIFGKAGTSMGGSLAGIAAAIPLSLFMMTIELLVAFLQAFIFTMLSATYIGMALEEPHGDHH